MVTASDDKTLRLWDLNTGVLLKKMEGHRREVFSLAVSSRDRQLIASGDYNGEVIIWDGETGESLTRLVRSHSSSNWIRSLDFSPDGKVLAGGSRNTTTKLWNTQTWQQQGDPIGCGDWVRCVRYSPSGELLAIVTDNNIRIYNSGTREHVASFKGHTSYNLSLAWTPDGTRLLTGGDSDDPTIREWNARTWQQVGDPWTGHSKYINAIAINPAGTLVASASDDNHIRLWRLSDRRTVAIFQHSSKAICVTFSLDGKHILSGGGDGMISEWAVPHPKILAITTARNACVNGDLSTAEELLTQDININPINHTSYCHRSFIMARKHHWDCALQDAVKSISIEPSLTGFISKGIAFCGKGHISDARAAFDVASTYTNQDLQTTHFLLLIKAIALFSADQHDEAVLLLKELTTSCPNADTRACHIVQTYLRVQLGIKASDDARHDEAAEHFTAAVNCSALSSASDIHDIYEDLVVLFGWDLKSLWFTAHTKLCDSLLLAGRLQDAVKSYRYMMDTSDDITKASCLNWSKVFTEECSASLTNGNAALAASNYDRAIHLYSVVIDLDCTSSDVVFANRSKAKLGKMLWEDALLDAQKVIELNSSSHVGYQLTHAALRGGQRYDEAIEAFTIMLSKLDDSHEAHIRDLRQQYVHPSQAENTIQRAVWIELEYAPLRLLNTSTGLVCDRAAQISSFKTSAKYKELLSFTTMHSDLRAQHIKDVVATYFRCVLLSHRWEETEALLHDIQDKVVYELNGLRGIAKLQSFCEVAREAGGVIPRFKNRSTPCSCGTATQRLPSSTYLMFLLHPVFGMSEDGLFKNLSLRKWLSFIKRIGRMSGARQKLQWASKRITTVQEDVAYSLFGIFGITLPVIYGEKKQNALGRLLQEIVARSGDITVLDWIGQPSEFNSCLPAHITSYTIPSRTPPSLSEDDIHTQVSLLRQTLRAPRFANCRLHLPCISFRVTEESPMMDRIKADGLHDLLVTTEETLVQFSRAKPILQTFLLVRPWDRDFLGVPDFSEQPVFTNDTESTGNWTESESLMYDSDKLHDGSPAKEQHGSRAFRLMVHLGQPFDAFLLAQQRVGEYKRIASDHIIVAQLKDISSVDDMDVGTVEIL
ncbi:hypothetical protein BDR07DRAFT_1429020 [Suillus spraguei]|nr:hypothetical protein BDR07DRAFT_1429020 [Suillus spraguei]